MSVYLHSLGIRMKSPSEIARPSRSVFSTYISARDEHIGARISASVRERAFHEAGGRVA